MNTYINKLMHRSFYSHFLSNIRRKKNVLSGVDLLHRNPRWWLPVTTTRKTTTTKWWWMEYLYRSVSLKFCSLRQSLALIFTISEQLIPPYWTCLKRLVLSVCLSVAPKPNQTLYFVWAAKVGSWQFTSLCRVYWYYSVCESGICLQCWGVYDDKFRKLARLYLPGTREFVALQNGPASPDPLHNSPYLSQFSVSLERLFRPLKGPAVNSLPLAGI
jgi:hypothetical protein